MTERNRNVYCEKLDIAVPRPEELLQQRRLKLFELVVIALLERGGPMSVDDLADRIAASGFEARTWDLRQSILKAWHGAEPVYRDTAGNLGLNLSYGDWELFLFLVGLRPPKVSAPMPPAEVTQPGDDVPLSPEEVDTAFRDRGLYAWSWRRQAAAVLDAANRSMKADEIGTVLEGLSRYRSGHPASTQSRDPHNLMRIDEAGSLSLNYDSPDLHAMRRAVRKFARPVLLRRAEQEAWRKVHEDYDEKSRMEQARLQELAAKLRHAVVHAVPAPDDPQAAVLLNVEQRTMRTYASGGFGELKDALQGFQVLAGLHIRTLLGALGLEADRWHLADLKPPKKTMRLNRAGRLLQITPDLLITSTTGISRPLGDPGRVAEYLAKGETGKLARRLESDAKALYAFYRFGAMHGYVRLRWGFIDDFLGVDFSAPGEPRLYDLLKQAIDSGTPIDIVTGNAPGWAEPWSRARRVQVLEIARGVVKFREQGVTHAIGQQEIQAIRIIGNG
jgi:hypothetical protein